MGQHYQTKIWQLQLPDAWKANPCGDEFVTFYRPDGVGTLTILTTDNSELATAEGDRIVHEPFPPEGREAEYGTSYSRTWTRRCRERKLLIRYSCAAKNSSAERREVDEIVQSISESDDHVA